MKKEEDVEFLKNFYKDRKVFVTGAFGFKGVWLTLLLRELGSKVYGGGLINEDNKMQELIKINDLDGVNLEVFDVNERSMIESIKEVNPSVIFHLAAQPLVSEGYAHPHETFLTNVMGTVNVMDAVRELKERVSFICVTTDKVYKNIEKSEPYVEGDVLSGIDPYSASKSCCEIVANSYRHSFFNYSGESERKVMSTCRAGNVIGGGDFAKNRIIPDLYSGLKNSEPVIIRNFEGIRPYEHVLDAVYSYVLLAARQFNNEELGSEYNIGPNDENIIKTKVITDFFLKHSNIEIIDGSSGESFREANLLSLDSSKFRKELNWTPTWSKTNVMLWKTFDWYAKLLTNQYNMAEITIEQIKEFLKD